MVSPGSARVLFVLAATAAAAAQDFGLDPLSPEVPGTCSAADILSPGPVVSVPTAALGVVPSGNVTALSWGDDACLDVHDGVGRLDFSVDRAAIGLPASAVAQQAAGDGAAGDILRVVVFGSNAIQVAVLQTGAPALGLTPQPAFESDVDALGLPGAAGGPGPWFTLDAASVAPPHDAATLFVVPAGGGSPVVYATSAQLGLAAGDEIDGLLLDDQGTPGVLDASDRVTITLAPGSPSGPPATLRQVWPATASLGGPKVFGLRPGERVDALAATYLPPVPWLDLGGGGGPGGVPPTCEGTGDLTGGSSNAVFLVGAPPSHACLLVVGFDYIGLPWKGSTLWPHPDFAQAYITGPTGAVAQPFPWPVGIPAGTHLYFQFFVGFAPPYLASNGLQATGF